jgi:NAD(P)-dependent dehydrogenase (short-subunit alcohol dehydrogenase family)
MQLLGKVALITGAGSGIGKAAALLLAKEGAKIGALEVDEETARKTVEQITETGGEAIAIGADVSDPEAVQAAVKELTDKYGRLDVVFANAGINGVWTPIEEMDPEEWDKTLDINLKGTFLTIKYAYPHLKKDGGSIVVTSSVNGTRTFKGERVAYACTKAGQVVMVKCLAVEFAKHNVRINAVCPGGIQTNIGENTEARNTEDVGLPVEYPEGRQPLNPGKADHVAHLVLFLSGPASHHISGTEIFIDGAETLVDG